MAKVKQCPTCGKAVKNPRAKFCSNKGRGNCKDRYHNEVNPRGYGPQMRESRDEGEFFANWSNEEESDI